MPWTIYCHIHVESGRRYIGLTSRTWQRRWAQHCVQSKSSKGGRWHFPNAIRKHGKDAFSHEVLETCETVEEANAAEEKWILHFDTQNPEKGFNLARGGSHTPHPVKNPWDRPEFRAKQLESGKRKWSDPEFLRKQADHSKSLSDNPDFKKKVSDAVKKAYEEDPSFKSRVGDSIREMWKNPDYRKKTSDAAREAVWRLESRAMTSRGTKAAAQTLGNQEARSLASKKLWSNPLFRESMSVGARERAQNPEWRSKCAPVNHSSSAKTHCIRGHEFTEANTNRYKGKRICRTCRRITQDRYAAKRHGSRLDPIGFS